MWYIDVIKAALFFTVEVYLGSYLNQSIASYAPDSPGKTVLSAAFFAVGMVVFAVFFFKFVARR